MAAVGRTSLDTERLFFIVVDGHAVFWFPSHAKGLQVWLVVFVHMKQVRHTGVVATLQHLNEYSYRSRMDVRVAYHSSCTSVCTTLKMLRWFRAHLERQYMALLIVGQGRFRMSKIF